MDGCISIGSNTNPPPQPGPDALPCVSGPFALLMTNSSEHKKTVRTLKIEAVGEFWLGLIKPKIRLTGYWLERAGFEPGTHVQVTCIAPGIIELRSPRT